MKKKRILIIGMTPTFGGMERYIVNLFAGLNLDLYDVSFLNQEPGIPIACEERLKKQGGRIVYAVKRKENVWRHYHELRKVFCDEYDVVYYNTVDLVNIDFLIFAIIFCKNAVKIVHAHDSQDTMSGIKHIIMCLHQKFIGKVSDKRYACSKTAGDWMFEGKEYKIINNMIDLMRFHFNLEQKEIMLKDLGLEGKHIWGTVGRITKQKNSLFLVEIMKYAYEIDKNIVFLHIGSGDLKDEMIAKIKEYGLEQNYLLLGEKENVEDYYQIMEKFIFPSLHEGLAFSIVEAQAMGIPCIVTDCANISKECDMKAGLMTWIPLSRAADEWSDVIYRLPVISDELRSEYGHFIIQAGFSLDDRIKKIIDEF